MTATRRKLTAANSAFLRDAKAQWNHKIYARVLELTNGPGGHEAALRYLAGFRRAAEVASAPAAEFLDMVAAGAPAAALSGQPLADEINAALRAKLEPEELAALDREGDDDKARRLEYAAARAAARWQRMFPCPPRTDDPELHALWIAAERMAAHAEGREPTIEGDQTPRTADGRFRLAQELVGVPLTLHPADGFATTTADALSEAAAKNAVQRLHDAGIGATRREDCDGRWGLIITLEG